MNVGTQLDQLERAQLLRRAGGTELAYLFKHALTQDAAYESLLMKQRRELHRRVAQAYETLYAERLDEFAALLAQHFAQAGEDTQVLEYATRAGDQAARVYANAEAIAEYSLALDAAVRQSASSEQFIHLYTSRGRALELVGKYEEAIANYTEMETLAHRRGDRAVELAALIALASVYALGETLASGEFAQSLCDQALALARELDDHAAEAKVLWTLMLLNTYLLNHPRKAVEYGERSLAIAREMDLRQQMAYTLHNLGYALMQGGANKRALDAFEQARALWRELDNQPLLADNLAISALTLLLSGQAQRSTALVDEAHSINQRIGNPWGLTMTYVAQGMLYAEALQPDRAIPALEESIRVGESIGTAGMTASARCVRAWLIGSLGKFERGIELAFDAIKFIDQRYPIWSAWPRAVLTRLYLLKGNLVEAERSSDGSWHASVEEYFSRFIPPGGMATCMTRAELLLSRKDFDRALEFADALYVFLQTGGFDLYVPDTLFFKGRIWLAQARSDHAYALFAQARRAAEDANARGVLWHILLALSRIENERGNTTESRTLRAQARQIVESVAAHTPVELKDAFRNLSEVREILN